jgi:SAM-dependent methyltransferase
MRSVLIVNHSGEKCGVYQFGAQLFGVLSLSDRFCWTYVDCLDAEDLFQKIEVEKPDAVVFNAIESLTMPWLTSGVLDAVQAIKFCVFHEVYQAGADAKDSSLFDFFLAPDPYLVPRNPRILPVPRFFLSRLTELPPLPEVFTVGSFGFATPGKGFEQLCALVSEQFERAVIRINIPWHDREDMCSADQISRIEEACHKSVTRAGVELNVTHEFFDHGGLLRFLAGNSLNAFLYTETGDRGLSSCIDHALAAGRPIAVSRSTMFRHMHGLNPSVCVEDLSLRQIFENGTACLEPLCRSFAPTAAADRWAEAIAEGLERHALRKSVPDGRGFNKILDDRSRHAYSKALDDLKRFSPEILARSYPQANIQQAFTLDTVERLAKSFEHPRILAVGSFEDESVAALRSKGYRVRGIDPGINVDLNDFYLSPENEPESYNIVVCVSVLEHVADDALFVRQVADLLEPGGVAVFTVDFLEDCWPDDPKPAVDFRLYTSDDILLRLMPVIPDCGLLDMPTWRDGGPEFTLENCTYNFAAWVFRKMPVLPFEYKDGAFTRLRTTPWKTQLVIPFPPDLTLPSEHRTFFHEYRPKYADVGLLIVLLRTLLSEVRNGAETIGRNSAETNRWRTVIGALFLAAMNREPLPPEASHWVEVGRREGLLAVVRGIVTAPEAQLQAIQKTPGVTILKHTFKRMAKAVVSGRFLQQVKSLVESVLPLLKRPRQ